MIVRLHKLLLVFLSGVICVSVLNLTQLSAQESSSRKAPRYAKLPKQDPVTPPAITEAPAQAPGIVTQEDEPQGPIVPGTLLDGSNLFKPIAEIPLRIIDQEERRPEDLAATKRAEIDYRTNYPYMFQDRVAMWCAPNIRYQPLYFEDVGLERYGYHCGDLLQPGASAVHFGASLAVMPVNWFRQPPWRCTYPLGFCRPGSLAPETKNKWLFWK